MDEVVTIRVPQDRETPVTPLLRSGHAYRYAYTRSDDSRRMDDIGQDYLVIRESGTRFAFALCDGVSQSFLGDLAATILAEALVNWLWEVDFEAGDPGTLVRRCRSMLADLTSPATEQVMHTQLPADLPGMLRDVLEQKRRIGSESTFVAGVIGHDVSPATFVWMGDSRLRIWLREKNAPVDFGDVFHTRERWSTRKGSVGEIRSYSIPSDEIVRMVAYSDGLAWADQQLTVSLVDDGLEQIIAESRSLPASDDVSYLEYVRRQNATESARDGALLHADTSSSRETEFGSTGQRVAAIDEPAALDGGATTLVPADSKQASQLIAGRVDNRVDVRNQRQGAVRARIGPRQLLFVVLLAIAVAVVVLAWL
ncbi:MAG: hypothetical protein IT337_05665 [Thermomicrobiales bacterium]|nr:hypothetical protein [Thermomicrobiales bacterium]